MELLDKRLGQHPHVADIRGRGYLVAVELVADRTTNQPFAPVLRLFDRVRRACLDRGLICYPSPGTVNGILGDHVLLSPPYIASRAELEEMVDLLALGIDDAIAESART